MERRLRTLVTGAASGIGFAVAEVLKTRGDQVVGIDYQPSGSWIQADLSKPTERKRAVDLAIQELGGIDVLVNVAGIFLPTPLESSTPDDWQNVWAVNLEAPIQLMSLVFGSMKSQGFGRIVNITSVHSRFSRVDCLAYDVGKAGLEAATRSVALDGAEFGIMVNAVAPGFVRTAMSLNDEGIDEADTEKFHQEYVSDGKLPLRRAAQPKEIAETVRWLTSEGNSYTTGQVLTVDGGLTATF